MKNLTNEELIILAKNNEQAKEYFFKRNENFSYFVAHKFFKKTNIELEDLVQIASIGMVKAFNSFKPEKNIKFATYAYMCMRNEILMVLRKKQPKLISISSKIEEDSKITFEDMLVAKDNTEGTVAFNLDFNKTLKNIKPRNKKIFNYFINGYSQSEIAKEMEISQAQVSRILKKIKTSIKKAI